MTPRSAIVFALAWLVSIGSAYCVDVEFSKVGKVTKIVVRADHNKTLSTITDTDRIMKIVAFIDERRKGWSKPWVGVPVPTIVADLYDGDKFKGHFGVGKNFFETQRFCFQISQR